VTYATSTACFRADERLVAYEVLCTHLYEFDIWFDGEIVQMLVEVAINWARTLDKAVPHGAQWRDKAGC
jgi:hypothetical protein